MKRETSSRLDAQRPLTARQAIALAAPALLLLIVLCTLSCGGGGAAPDYGSTAPEQALARRAGTFSVLAIDSEGSPVQWPDSLTLSVEEASGSTVLSIDAVSAAPDDLYFRLSYEQETLSFSELALSPARAGEYLSLAVANRVPGELQAGLARIGSRRGTAADAGPLLTVSFAPGRDRTYRGTSTVNVDPDSATELFVETELQVTAVLRFTERNIGDYNNNSQVEIADITPVGLYFGQLVSTAPDPEKLVLVDGDGNGEINAADLVPIARNFNTRIDGFHVYRTNPPVPGDAPLAVLSRSAVFEAATQDERKRRLVYRPEVPLEVGENTLYVAPFSSLEDPDEVGLPSNSVVATGSVLNQPPIWLTTVGVASVEPASAGLRLAFGTARDPEGGAVEYVLNFSRNSDPVFGLGSETLVLPAPEGDPPYTYLFENDEHGSRFNFNLRARDPEGNTTKNTETVSGVVPAIALPADPWPGPHGGSTRNGVNLEASFDEPLEPAWSVPITIGGDLPHSEFSPVISADGWVGVLDGETTSGTFSRFSTQDGSLIAAHPYDGLRITTAPSLFGDVLAVGTTNGVAIFDLTTLDPPVEYDMGGRLDAAPLLLGDYVFCCDLQGQTYALLAATGEEVWRHQLEGGFDNYILSPATDGVYLYTASVGGKVNKFDLLTGEVAASGSAGISPVGDAVVVSPARSRLYLTTFSGGRVDELSTHDLAHVRDVPVGNQDVFATSEPCIVEYSDPPMAVLGYKVFPHTENNGHVFAYDLDSGETIWDTELLGFDYADGINASADRLVVGRYSLDFHGNLRQALFADEADFGAMHALSAGGVFSVGGADSLYAWQAAEQDLPPQWVGDAGISGLDSGQYSLTPHWGHAENDHNMPVYYAVFIAAGGLPQFDPPYTDTTVIHSIPPAGEGVFGFEELHEYLVDGLINGTRYYVGVRAYERPRDDEPRFDDNVNYRAVTPPWQREVLVVGDDVPSPTGGTGIFAMRGLVDPAGDIHLYYTSMEDGTPAHAWGGTGNWQAESVDLGNYVTPSFDLYWDGGLVAGWAFDSQVGLLRRNGVDDWTPTVIPATEATVNPQLSFAISGETMLAYTEHLFGTLPPTLASSYWYVETVDGEWQDPVVIDDQDESGRDLQLVLGGPGADTPWIAFQRGKDYASGRFTAKLGQVFFARPDGGGGFDLELVDAGANAPDSDCGKRLRQVLGSDGKPRLAYLDLNASPDQALGQLKFAQYSGSAWAIESVLDIDLSFQPGGAQHTWGELSLLLAEGDLPVIGMLSRKTDADSFGLPHQAAPDIWFGEEPEWRREPVWDAEWVVPRDREPCVLLRTPDGALHMFYAMALSEGPAGVAADRLVHMYRPPDA